MHIPIFLSFLLAITSGAVISHAGEAEDRKAIREVAANAFKAGRYAELDEMAERFRTERERTGSGIWKLDEFYNGLSIWSLETDVGEATFDRFEAGALEWTVERPKSITAKLVYAGLLQNHKWFKRGYDFWQRLTPEQRDGFWEYHVKEREYLVSVYTPASADPRWYAMMMENALQERWSDSEFDALVAEASAREPYYYDTWYNAIDRNLPMWGGSYERTGRFIRRVRDITGVADGDTFLARGYWYVYERDGREAADQLGLNWVEVDKGFDDLIRAFPSQWNINAHAKFACLARDRAKFLKRYVQIKPGLVHEIWDSGAQPMKCAVWGQDPERGVEPD